MPNLAIPNWLEINPLESVPFFLQGFGQGERAGSSVRQGEQQANEFDQAQQLKAEQEAAIEADAERTRQDKAATAAKQFAGMQKYQQAVAGGKPSHEALIDAAPEMFYQNPAAFATALNREEVNAANREKQASNAAHQLQLEQLRWQRLADAATNAADRNTLNDKKLEAEKAAKQAALDLKAATSFTTEEQILRDELKSLLIQQSREGGSAALTEQITAARDALKEEMGKRKTRKTPEAKQSAGTPAVGEVRKGYKFLGGDPAKEESWQQL